MKTFYLILSVFILTCVSCDLLEKVDENIIDISGKISDEGNAVVGAIVLLVETAEISDGLNLANGSISDNAGNYLILNVDSGDYYVLAIDDRNNNQQFDSATDRIGFYGLVPDEFDLQPDLITVADTDLEDINIVDLYSLE